MNGPQIIQVAPGSSGAAIVVGSSGPPAIVDTGASGDQQIRTLQAHLSVLADANSKDDAKLKAAQELSDGLETVVSGVLQQQQQQQPQQNEQQQQQSLQTEQAKFMDATVKTFLKVLNEVPIHNIAEYR